MHETNKQPIKIISSSFIGCSFFVTISLETVNEAINLNDETNTKI